LNLDDNEELPIHIVISEESARIVRLARREVDAQGDINRDRLSLWEDEPDGHRPSRFALGHARTNLNFSVNPK